MQGIVAWCKALRLSSGTMGWRYETPPKCAIMLGIVDDQKLVVRLTDTYLFVNCVLTVP
jgi:hypothetical protein